MKSLNLHIIVICCIAIPVTSYAELPLAIEDLITDKGLFKLDLTFSYTNADRKNIDTKEPITVQTSATSFTTIPSIIGESYGNSDTLVGTLGLRYGIMAKTEFYGRFSYLKNTTRITDLDGTTSSSESDFAESWIGFNCQFKQENGTPALLGFLETALSEEHKDHSTSFKSWMAGLTGYKAIDPVVFSLTVGYRFNQEHKANGVQHKPGYLLLLNSSIAFAVNDRVTTSTGVQWTNQDTDKYDGISQGSRRTKTDLLLGVGYGFSKESIINFTLIANVSGQDGATLMLNCMHTF